MQNIQILGTQIRDHTKWESLGIAERYLRNRALEIVLYINNRELNMASTDMGFRQFVENAGLTLWSASDLAQVAGLKNDRRHREVENREFLKELLQRLAKNHYAVAVVAETPEKVQALKTELLSVQEKLSIVSSFCIGGDKEVIEQTVNQINSVAPAIIIAKMPMKMQYYWLTEAKHMVNAGIWLAIPEDMKLNEQEETKYSRFLQKIKTTLTKKKVMRYKKEQTK